ncbi:uncharacterized protein LTR77_011122 [Saxophila tyrrhenica]|uniref:Methyltransferase domain-containing protein n=1 Tax=Saxophila tyrrhenica TaxID=1690608 RepID=A0AAV9NTF1_9PEZI|nr:hypothetical protein LTR77_011122 [Saxophila tyrrhenica]
MAAKGLESDEAPWQKMVKVFGARTAKNNAAHLLPHLKSNFRILDVGCGIGSITIDLANLVLDGEVVGIDTNESTTPMAQQMAQDKGVSNVKFSFGDAHDLSAFPDESFDVVHAHQVALHLPNPVKALKEMRRVLKTGGVLSLRDNIDLMHYPLDPWIQKNQDWFRDLSRKSGANPQGGSYTHDWTHQAGFPWDKIDSAVVSWSVSTLEDRRFWASGGKNAFRTMGLKAGYGNEKDYDEIERAWEAWAEKDEGRMV